MWGFACFTSVFINRYASVHHSAHFTFYSRLICHCGYCFLSWHEAFPEDPCKSILGEKATAAVCDKFVADYGLDEPLTKQFVLYIGRVLRGDLGESIRFGRPVSLIIVERLPLTMELGFSAMLLALLIGIPAGIISAMRRNSLVDVITMVGANLGVSIPVFVLGLILIYIFAVLLKDSPIKLPPSGRLSPGVLPVPFYEHFGWDLEPSSPRFLSCRVYLQFLPVQLIYYGRMGDSLGCDKAFDIAGHLPLAPFPSLSSPV